MVEFNTYVIKIFISRRYNENNILRTILHDKNTFSKYLMSRSSYDGGEHSPWGIVSGKPGLAHTGAIVNNQGLYIIRHFD